MITKNETKFLKILEDVSRLPEKQANEALTFIADLLICTIYGGDNFSKEAQRLLEEGNKEALKKLVKERAGH